LYVGADGIGTLLGSPRLSGLLRIFALYPVCMLPTLAVEGTLLHANRPAAVVIFNALVRVGMFLALVIPTLYHAPLTRTISIWTLVGAVMGVLALLLMLSTVRGVRGVWRREMLRDEWKFSLPLAAVAIISISSNYIDRLLVSHAFGAAAFGVYTNGTIEIPTVTMVTNATSVVLLAEFSRRSALDDFAGMMTVWHRAMIKTSVLIFASLGFLAFWAPETMRVVFSNRFADSGMVFSIYVWIVPLFLFAMPSLYMSLGATRILVYITTVDLLLGAVLVPLCGHYYGLIGMAFGAILARYIGTALWVHWFACWLTKIGWAAFMPWRKVGTAFALAVLAGAISRGVFLYWVAPWPLLTVMAVAALGYLALLAGGLHMTRLLYEVIPARGLAVSRPTQREVSV
jgi:O-antigen/teichoic acid export membrane protein